MKKLFFLLIMASAILMKTGSMARADSYIVTIADIEANPGTEVNVPVTVDGFKNVSVIEMRFVFDDKVLDASAVDNYLQNIHSGIRGRLAYNLINESTIAINWYTTNPINIEDGAKLFDLHFLFCGDGSDCPADALSNIVFDRKYTSVHIGRITDNTLEEVDLTMIDGSVRNIASPKILTLATDGEGNLKANGEPYSTPLTISEGGTVSLEALPATGWEFNQWTDQMDNVVSNEALFDYTMPGEDMTLTAGFSLKSYEITAEAVPGEGGSVSGTGEFEHGEVVTLTASPAEGYEFRHWREDDSVVEDDPTYSFTATSDRELTAHFSEEAAELFIISLESDPEDAGSLSGSGSYEEGEEVSISASPNTGYHFIRWTDAEGEEITTNASFTYTMPATDVSFTAHFGLNSYEITASADPDEGGTINGEGTYDHGEEVTLEATPSEEYYFRYWGENGEEISGDRSFTFTASADRHLIAYFDVEDPEFYTLSLVTDPADSGTLSGGGQYPAEAQRTVSVAPNEGYELLQWTGHDGEVISTNESFEYIMPDHDVTLTAHLELKSHEITLAASPEEGGSVTGGGTYDHGEEVTVTASPAEGYEFRHWREDGQVITENPSLTFTAQEDRSLTAHFTPLYTLTLLADPEEGGSVTGAGEYEEGEEVSLSASPETSYVFSEWADEDGQTVSTEAAFTFTMPAEHTTLTASFTEEDVPVYTLTLLADPEEGGSVTGAGEYEEGEEVSLSASPETGYAFTEWTDEDGQTVSTEAAFTFTMPAEHTTLTAHFTEEAPETFEVTFEVDLSRAITHGLLEDFDPGTHQIFISGEMTDWSEPGDDPDNQLMEKTSNDPLVYRKVFHLEEGSYEYKYFSDYLGNGWEGGEWEGDPNREVEVSADMVIEDQFGPDDLPVSEIETIDLKIYPNPASTRLTIESDREMIRIRIIDMIGQTIYTGEATPFSHTIDTSGLPNGVYILRVETTAGITTERIQISGN